MCKFLGNGEYGKWDRFAADSPQGSIYSKSFWLQSVSDVLGYKHDIIAVYHGDEIAGGIGVFSRNRSIIIPPLIPYLSPVLRERKTADRSKIYHERHDLLRNLAGFLKGHYRGVEVCMRDSIKDIRAFSWMGYKIYVKYTFVNTIENFNAYPNVFAHSIRKQIRKCKEGNMEVIKEDDLERFWSIFKLTFERQKESLPVNKKQFIELYNRLSRNGCGEMWTAFFEGKPVSARIILFSENDTVHDWVAAAHPDHLRTGATSYLIYKIMEHYSQRGFKYFDWNGANMESIARFKSNFGGKLTPYYAVSWARPSVQLMKYGRRMVEKGLEKLRK
jgi:hypothetical protein